MLKAIILILAVAIYIDTPKTSTGSYTKEYESIETDHFDYCNVYGNVYTNVMRVNRDGQASYYQGENAVYITMKPENIYCVSIKGQHNLGKQKL
jgi:hypothetical protein